jgi:3',5'-cyclic-AMP phosphodiesterase
MKISKLNTKSVETYSYLIVQTGGRREDGNRLIEEVHLPILMGQIEGLGNDLDAIIATSDLQGNVKDGDKICLLGEKLPEFLATFFDIELPHLDRKKVGIILCGDLYANLEKRGDAGDVKDVWFEFRKYFKWVVGVAGNHDEFGNTTDFNLFKQEKNIHFLDRQIKEIDKIKFGGISGIIGRNDKSFRSEEGLYLDALKKILLKQPSSILLHQGPNDEHHNQIGHEGIRKIITMSPPNLIFCGHCHWDIPLVTFENGSQILNLDGRVVILVKNTEGVLL